MPRVLFFVTMTSYFLGYKDFGEIVFNITI